MFGFKQETSCSLKFLTYIENKEINKSEGKITVLNDPKTVAIHAFSTSIFSAVSTASHIIGTWQKHVVSFQATLPLTSCIASGWLCTDGM